MNHYLGKVFGAILGFVLAGPSGAAIGLVIGHLSDLQNRARRRHEESRNNEFFPDFSMSPNQKSIFSLGIIVLGAKLAKADGHVSNEEILAFRRVFRSQRSQLAEVGKLFDKARLSTDGYEPYAARLAGAFAGQPEILEEILAGLFYIAAADSPRLTHPEIVFLNRVAVIFGIDEASFRNIAGRVGIHIKSPSKASPGSNAYAVLGLSRAASDKDVKRTYRALIRKNHPDVLVAQGLPASAIEEATERMKKINAAYGDICKERGLK